MKAVGMEKAIVALNNIADLVTPISERIYEELNTSRNNILLAMKATPRQENSIKVPGRKNVFHYPAKKGSPPAIMNGQLSGDLKLHQSISGNSRDTELGTTVKHGSRHEGTETNPGHHQYMKPELNDLLPRLPKSLMEVVKNANR